MRYLFDLSFMYKITHKFTIQIGFIDKLSEKLVNREVSLINLVEMIGLTFILLLLFILEISNSAQVKQTSRDTENRTKKLSENTKKMIKALAAAGHPKSSIAERIKYDVGDGTKPNKATAGNIILIIIKTVTYTYCCILLIAIYVAVIVYYIVICLLMFTLYGCFDVCGDGLYRLRIYNHIV